MLLSQEFSVSGWSGVFTDMLTQKSLQKMHSNRCFTIHCKTVDLFFRTPHNRTFFRWELE